MPKGFSTDLWKTWTPNTTMILSMRYSSICSQEKPQNIDTNCHNVSSMNVKPLAVYTAKHEISVLSICFFHHKQFTMTGKRYCRTYKGWMGHGFTTRVPHSHFFLWMIFLEGKCSFGEVPLQISWRPIPYTCLECDDTKEIYNLHRILQYIYLTCRWTLNFLFDYGNVNGWL